MQQNIIWSDDASHIATDQQTHIAVPHAATMARYAMAGSYSPYSKFRVGCYATGKALYPATAPHAPAYSPLNEIGFSAANVENSSFGLTICAERIAVGALIFRLTDDVAPIVPTIVLTMVAFATDGLEFLSPCGACLQFMHEFADDETLIVHSRSPIDAMVWTFRECLPYAKRVL